MESWEIVGIEMDEAGCWQVVGAIGPYLSKEEAEADLPHITEKNLKNFKNKC